MATAPQETLSTRDRMLREARALFAERGFYGVSIAQIAAELGLTKQALLHHFGTKERLYGLVLEQIAGEFAALKPTLDLPEDPSEALTDYFAAMVSKTPAEIERSRLLMREILDNKARAQSAGQWYLRPFLEDLMAMLSAVRGWEETSADERLAMIVQLVGAVSYHAVSGPTFRGIFGADGVAAMDGVFAEQMRTLVRGALERG